MKPATPAPAAFPRVPPRIREAFLETAHRIGRCGYARCSSGNLSLRLDDEHLLVSASRSRLERLVDGDLSICRIADGALVAGNRPSVETGFHSGIMRTRPDVEVVLHFQSPAATAFCCRSHPVCFDVIPEIPFYIGAIGWVPFILPGTPELASAVVAAMRTSNLVLLQNHGIVTVAGDLDHAVEQAEFFELACEILLRNGDESRLLDPEAIAELRRLGGTPAGVV